MSGRGGGGGLGDEEAEVGGGDGDGGFQERVAQARQQQHGAGAHGGADDGPAEAQAGRLADVGGDRGGGEGEDEVAELVGDDGGAVVEDGLGLDEHAQVGEAAELFEQGDDGDGVGGGEDPAEEEALGPCPAVGEDVAADQADEERLKDDAGPGQHQAAEKVLGELVHVGVRRALVDEGRKEDEEDELAGDAHPHEHGLLKLSNAAELAGAEAVRGG